MHKLISLRNGHTLPSAPVPREITDYHEMVYAQDAAMLLACATTFGSCAIYGAISTPNATKLVDDVRWMAQNAYGLDTLTVGHEAGEVSETSVEKAFEETRAFSIRNSNQSIIIFDDLNSLTGKSPESRSNAQEMAAVRLAKLLESSIRPTICAISYEDVSNSNNEATVLPQFAASVTFKGIVEHAMPAVIPADMQTQPVHAVRTTDLQYAFVG